MMLSALSTIVVVLCFVSIAVQSMTDVFERASLKIYLLPWTIQLSNSRVWTKVIEVKRVTVPFIGTHPTIWFCQYPSVGFWETFHFLYVVSSSISEIGTFDSSWVLWWASVFFSNSYHIIMTVQQHRSATKEVVAGKSRPSRKRWRDWSGRSSWIVRDTKNTRVSLRWSCKKYQRVGWQTGRGGDTNVTRPCVVECVSIATDRCPEDDCNEGDAEYKACE